MKNASKDAADNRSNQMNPNNGAYWSSRGTSDAPATERTAPSTGLTVPSGSKEQGKK